MPVGVDRDRDDLGAELGSWSRWRGMPGSSTAMTGARRAARSAVPISVNAVRAAGDHHVPGSATTPRTRARYAASGARSSDAPRGSG